MAAVNRGAANARQVMEGIGLAPYPHAKQRAMIRELIAAGVIHAHGEGRARTLGVTPMQAESRYWLAWAARQGKGPEHAARLKALRALGGRSR